MGILGFYNWFTSAFERNANGTNTMAPNITSDQEIHNNLTFSQHTTSTYEHFSDYALGLYISEKVEDVTRPTFITNPENQNEDTTYLKNVHNFLQLPAYQRVSSDYYEVHTKHNSTHVDSSDVQFDVDYEESEFSEKQQDDIDHITSNYTFMHKEKAIKITHENHRSNKSNPGGNILFNETSTPNSVLEISTVHRHASTAIQVILLPLVNEKSSKIAPVVHSSLEHVHMLPTKRKSSGAGGIKYTNVLKEILQPVRTDHASKVLSDKIERSSPIDPPKPKTDVTTVAVPVVICALTTVCLLTGILLLWRWKRSRKRRDGMKGLTRKRPASTIEDTHNNEDEMYTEIDMSVLRSSGSSDRSISRASIIMGCMDVDQLSHDHLHEMMCTELVNNEIYEFTPMFTASRDISNDSAHGTEEQVSEDEYEPVPGTSHDDSGCNPSNDSTPGQVRSLRPLLPDHLTCDSLDFTYMDISRSRSPSVLSDDERHAQFEDNGLVVGCAVLHASQNSFDPDPSYDPVYIPRIDPEGMSRQLDDCNYIRGKKKPRSMMSPQLSLVDLTLNNDQLPTGPAIEEVVSHFDRLRQEGTSNISVNCDIIYDDDIYGDVDLPNNNNLSCSNNEDIYEESSMCTGNSLPISVPPPVIRPRSGSSMPHPTPRQSAIFPAAVSAAQPSRNVRSPLPEIPSGIQSSLISDISTDCDETESSNNETASPHYDTIEDDSLPKVKVKVHYDSIDNMMDSGSSSDDEEDDNPHQARVEQSMETLDIAIPVQNETDECMRSVSAPTTPALGSRCTPPTLPARTMCRLNIPPRPAKQRHASLVTPPRGLKKPAVPPRKSWLPPPRSRSNSGDSAYEPIEFSGK